MFVVDDLVSWLVGRLADAGYQKLNTRLRGSDQERALKRAVAAAVQATADEISPAGQEQAKRLAELISGAFGKPTPAKLLPRKLTRLEGLYAGIGQQLSVLDDGGQPPGGLLGVPVSVVAHSLTDHLVDEIKNSGAEGGSLTPLADQLNHDRTQQQGEEIKSMLAQLLGEARDGPTRPSSASEPTGSPLAEVRDPFALEVHRPVEPDVPQPGLTALPAYVPREHDAALAQVITAAAAGTSGIAVLVGGSSTGKTRACWQALELLRGQEPEWRLWHPIDPQGTLADLSGTGPRTVVWLNEAQLYLGPADGTGERVAAGLRKLLLDLDRGPVLVLATLWPQFWAELTTRPPSGAADPHAQARELLDGHDIPVPAAFTPAQLRQLEEAGDPRLAQAATGSRDGQVIQYLAGAPELLVRYRNAPPSAQALIHAAMDARRLGMRPALSRAFLETAAPGYLTDTDWDLLPGDWLEQALDYTAAPSKGVRGPLTPIRPRPDPGVPASRYTGPTCQLVDYLDQQGRRARRQLIPPAAFWAAAASYADPADLTTLAQASQDRGLLRDAARLYKQASAHGYPIAGASLVRLLNALYPGDRRPADWAVAHVSPDDPRGVAILLDGLRGPGAAAGQVTALLDRDPAAHASLDDREGVAWLLDALRGPGAAGQVATLASRAVAHASLDDPGGVAILLNALDRAGAAGQVTALLDRDPAAHASLDDPVDVASLLNALGDARAAGQVATLASRAVAHASLDDPRGVAWLLDELRGRLGAGGQVTALASRAVAHASLDDPGGVGWLLDALDRAGAAGQVTALLDRDPAAHASLDDPGGVASLLNALRGTGAAGQVTALLDRDPAAHASLDDPGGVASLLNALGDARAAGQVTALLDRDPAAHASLDDRKGVAWLLDELRGRLGVGGQVIALASRAVAHASLDDPFDVAWLLDALRRAGAAWQVTDLASRAVAHASLDDPFDVASLLDELRRVEAAGQVTPLASRAVAHASLDDPFDVAILLDELRRVGAAGQAAELIERLPAAGLFDLFYRQEGRAEQFRFGREADGRPAKPWAWTDLG